MKILPLTIVFLCLSSCYQGMDMERHLFGNYYLVAPDTKDQLSLCYQDPNDKNGGFSGLIEETVFAVGYNAKYIIAKQHPGNKRVTNYFILPLKHSNRWGDNRGLIGPLTFDEFILKERELKIENLYFTIVYKDLE